MKNFIGVVYLLVLIQLSYCQSSIEASEKFLTAVDNCKEETNVDAEEYEKFMNHEISEVTEGKCFAACVFEKVSYITPDRKTNKSTIVEIIPIIYPDPDDAKKAEEIVDECIDKTDDDVCEAVYKIEKCWFTVKEAKGLGDPS